MSPLIFQRVSTFHDYQCFQRKPACATEVQSQASNGPCVLLACFCQWIERDIFIVLPSSVIQTDRHHNDMVHCSDFLGRRRWLFYDTSMKRWHRYIDSRALENVWLCRRSNIGQSGQCVICALTWWCQGHFVSKFILGNEVVWPIIKTNIFSIPTGYLLCMRYCLLCWICVLYACEWLRTKSSLLFLIRRVLPLGRNQTALSPNFFNGSQIFNVIFKMSALKPFGIGRRINI